MSSTATDSALAISVFAVDELYYNITPNYGTAIFTLLGSQLFGFVRPLVPKPKNVADPFSKQLRHRRPHAVGSGHPRPVSPYLTDICRSFTVFPTYMCVCVVNLGPQEPTDSLGSTACSPTFVPVLLP